MLPPGSQTYSCIAAKFITNSIISPRGVLKFHFSIVLTTSQLVIAVYFGCATTLKELFCLE